MPLFPFRQVSRGLIAVFLLPVLILTCRADYVSEIEPNDSVATAQNVNGFFTLDDNPDVAGKFSPTSTIIPHASIDGFGDGTGDYYSFSAKAGDRIILDVDYTSNDFNSFIRLFDPTGTEISNAFFQRPEFGGEGSDRFDAFLQARATTDGTYTVAIDDCCPAPLPSGAWYELQISVGSPAAAVALTGQPVPELPAGAIFASFGNPIINSKGHTAFQAKLKTGTAGITSLNDAAIFAEGNFASGGSGSGSGSSSSASGSGGALAPYHSAFLVVQEGDIAPGTADGVFTKFNDPVNNFSAFPSYYSRSSDGVAFRGTLKIAGSVTKDNDTGIWAYFRGLLELVAREGDQAPGCPPGAVFASFTALAMPDNAGVAFLAKLKPGVGNVTAANSVGIWATDLDGNLNLVVRRGDTVNIGGLPRLVSSIAIFNTASGTAQTRHAISGGELLYRASYQGGLTGLMRYVP